MKKIYEKYMFLIGGSGSLIFYLQAIKIFREQSAAAVSLLAFIVGFISVVSWMIYGILIKNRVLFISNILATIGAFLVIVGILIYKP
jgi:MtN3 and saliva related transmembrane protein